MLAEMRITTNDVARAEFRLRDARERWGLHGFRKVADDELAEAEGRVAQCAEGLASLRGWRWRFMPLKIALYWLLDRSRLMAAGWLPGTLIVATASLVLSAVPLVLLVGRPIPVFVGLATSFLIPGWFAGIVLCFLSDTDFDQEIEKGRGQLTARREKVEEWKRLHSEWRGHLKQLHCIRAARIAYEKAERDYTRLVELLQSRRYQLAHCDWRALRGTAFEDFIADVFEELGFAVERTKVTGDQGVDLVVTGRGRSIAVQTKGYKKQRAG